jgi:enoyl-CoA hydratase
VNTETNLVVAKRSGAVMRIVLNRPAKHNAINAEMAEKFTSELQVARKDPDTRVVVLSGAGRSFCSGADHGNSDGPHGLDEVHPAIDVAETQERVEDILHIWGFPKPLIAQVHGYCLGSANELASACDLVICGSSTKIGAPEARRGVALVPTLSFWPAVLGPQRTKELLFTGRLIGAEEAVRLGIAIATVPDEELESYVDQVASKISELPLARAVAIKQAVNSWSEAMGLRDAAFRGAQNHAIYHSATQLD